MPNQSVDRVFQALADPTRREIVERLVQRSESVSEIARPLSMSLPAVMQHLNVLEGAGLVRSQKVGRVRTCQIVPSGLRRLETWITAQRGDWEKRLDRLGEALQESSKGGRQ